MTAKPLLRLARQTIRLAAGMTLVLFPPFTLGLYVLSRHHLDGSLTLGLPMHEARVRLHQAAPRIVAEAALCACMFVVGVGWLFYRIDRARRTTAPGSPHTDPLHPNAPDTTAEGPGTEGG